MEIRQEFNTFVRNIEGRAYIYNSKTKEELFIDENGFYFLSQICREWRILSHYITAQALM